MANGIKLRRGLQAALTGTIAEGELVMATDTGKLGLKKGTTEHFVDLPTLVTAVANLQPTPPVLHVELFESSINLYDISGEELW